MKHHEFASLFPMLSDTELQSLADDIKANGQLSPIITLDGEILDGRNRDRACELAGVQPWYEAYQGNNPLAFVVSSNLHRRQLNESQRGMVAARLASLESGHRADRQGESIDAPKIPDRKEAGEMLNVGESTVTRSRKVLREGAPELIAAVDSGEIKVGAAYKLAELPKEEQAEAVKAGPETVKAKAAEIRKADKPEMDQEKPPAKRPEKLPKYIPDHAPEIWIQARTHLERILPDDIHWESVFNEIITYCKSKLAA